MDLIASGKVVHAGTLNGNPIVLAAAKAALDVLTRPGVYETLDRLGQKLRNGIEQLFRRHGYSVVTSGVGAVFHVSFMDQPARDYRATLAANRQLYAELAAALLDEGVLVLQDGRWYLSTAHDDAAIDNTLDGIDRVLRVSQ